MTHTHTTYHEAVHAALHLLADDMGYEIPTHADIAQERTYLRALMNMRDPAPLPDGYPEAEAIVLDTERERKGTATWEDRHGLVGSSEDCPVARRHYAPGGRRNRQRGKLGAARVPSARAHVYRQRDPQRSWARTAAGMRRGHG